MTDLKEGKITVFDWWRNKAEFFLVFWETGRKNLFVDSFNGVIERSFKSRGLIHTKTRNRLASETTSKLTFH